MWALTHIRTEEDQVTMKTFLVKMQMNTVMTQPIVREAKIAQINVKPDVWQKRALGALLEYQGRQVWKAFKDTQEWKDFLAQRETRDIQECKDQEDQKETGAKWACLDSLVSMESLP